MENKYRTIVDRMSIREKIGQTVQLRLSMMRNVINSDGTLQEFLEKYPIGSVFGGADIISRFSSRENPVAVIERCNRLSKIPLSVAGDLEHGGGNVRLPSQLALAASRSPEDAYDFGKWCALGGREFGFTWTYSPEVDIAFSWHNPVNNHRGLGDDPELIMELASNVVKGLQDNMVSAGCKHFPGDGSDFRDQHIGPSLNRLSRKRWMDTYGRIYRKMISSGTHSIMPGHISLPFMDMGRGLPPPATLSRKILEDLLRGELGFEGVIVSDALVMGGFNWLPLENDRLVTAFQAGCDVMLWPDRDILNGELPDLAYFDNMLKALDSGFISEKRLDESVMRILQMKDRQGILDPAEPVQKHDPAEIEINGNDFGRKLAQKGAVLLRNSLGILPLQQEKTKKVLLWFAVNKEEVVAKEYQALAENFRSRGAEVEIRINGNANDLKKLEMAGGNFDTVIFLFDSSTHAILNSCRPMGAAAEVLWIIHNGLHHQPVVIGLNTPYIIMEDPALQTVVNTHCRGQVCAESLVPLLYGEVPFSGTSPVNLDNLLDVDENL